MKILRPLTALVMISLGTAAFAQTSPAPTEAQQTFKALKALAGTWEGHVTTTPKAVEVEGKAAKVSLRVTSMGNLLMHEMNVDGRPDDPITTLYLDEGKLMLTHYCDAGNRPRMVAKTSPDGKTVEFDFVDVSGPLTYGHMHHVKFTIIDADHHSEEWTFMVPGDKHVTAHIDLERVKSSTSVAAK